MPKDVCRLSGVGRVDDPVFAKSHDSTQGGRIGVDFSSDGGKTWQPAKLGKDEGKYSFRSWEAHFSALPLGFMLEEMVIHPI